MSHPTTPRTWYKTPLRVIYGDPMGYGGKRGVSRAFRPALSVRMRVWIGFRTMWLTRVPRANDATRACCPGVRPNWILIVGNGAARGWGVRSHNEALPGHLARAVSAFTGRGTDVVVVTATSRAEIRSAILTRVDARYDAIVIVTGIEDALAMRDPELWRTEVRSFLTHLSGPTGVDAPLVLVGIPPASALPAFDTAMGQLASAHGVTLNAVTRDVCREFPRATYSELADPRPLDPRPHDPHVDRSSETYRLWATGIADAVRPLIAPPEPHRVPNTST
jgi:hypothetical protein